MNCIHIVLLVLTLWVASSLCDCTDYSGSSCGECVAHKSWNGDPCRWCELDSTCHAFGSIENRCNVFENIVNSTYCNCVPSGCLPVEGYGPQICIWYNSSSSPFNPNNPSTWDGADFLPWNYRSAASCACSGDGNALWETTAASCVRTAIIKGHQSLSNELKWGLRNYTKSFTLCTSNGLSFLPTLYDIHINAYASCCCPGHVAAYLEWVAIFCSGGFFPCAAIPSAILSQGRCGCGW